MSKEKLYAEVDDYNKVLATDDDVECVKRMADYGNRIVELHEVPLAHENPNLAQAYAERSFDGELGYLNINISTGMMTAGNVCETELFKTKFTNKAIEQLKQRDDIPLDWNRVILEEADRFYTKEAALKKGTLLAASLAPMGVPFEYAAEKVD